MEWKWKNSSGSSSNRLCQVLFIQNECDVGWGGGVGSDVAAAGMPAIPRCVCVWLMRAKCE